jgi:allophanate hydrolase subunit 1
MSKKIKKEELKSIQDKVQAINNVQMQIGGLEVQKSIAIEKLKAFQQELNVVQKTLEDKYGKVSVNITDGTIKEIEDGPLN